MLERGFAPNTGIIALNAGVTGRELNIVRVLVLSAGEMELNAALLSRAQHR